MYEYSGGTQLFKENDEDKGSEKMKKKIEKCVSGSGGGYAAPVRELPRGVFQQKKWDQCASSSNSSNIPMKETWDCHRVSLQYSIHGVPSTALYMVETKLEDDVRYIILVYTVIHLLYIRKID